MRRFILLFFIAALIAGCATTYYDSAGNPVPKEKMEQLRMEAVRAHLEEHRYRIFMDSIYNRLLLNIL